MKNLRLLFSFVALAMHLCAIAQQGSKPNIVFILADDLGYADLGCYGQQKISTPQLDKMASAGLKFTNFYAGTSVCAPSRASFMTGLHTGHTAVRGNRGFKPEGQFPLPEGTVTLAHLLQAQGYRTAAFGKWGLGFPGSTGIPAKMGFNEFYGYICQTLAHNYFPDHLWHNEKRIDLPNKPGTDAVYSGDLIHQQALSFINQKQDAPFFLFLPYTLPHGDLDVPHDSTYNSYVKKFAEAALPVPAKLLSGDRHEPYPHAAFAAMIARLDKYVGEILSALKANGLAENTLVIFSSDNGPHREDGGDPEFFASSGKLRGIKRDLYEGGIRVPGIAYFPGKIKPGVTQQPAAFWDLLPTFCELAGSKEVVTMTDGISIVPTLFSKGKQKQHEYFYWEFHEKNGRQAVRMSNWKGVVYNASNQVPDAMQLFDLATDVGEKNDIASQHPKVVAALWAIIKKQHQPNTEWPLLFAENIGK